MFPTLPTSTPAIRTKSPSLRPVTLVKSALYVLPPPNRNCANTAINAKVPKAPTAKKAVNRHTVDLRLPRTSFLLSVTTGYGVGGGAGCSAAAGAGPGAGGTPGQSGSPPGPYQAAP